MIVVCDGMPRSGSTWAFNVCLRLVRLRWPAANVFCGFRKKIGEYLEEIGPEHDHAVLKTHRLDTGAMALCLAGGVRSVHTYRDPYDAVFSLQSMFNLKFEGALEALRWGLMTRAFHQAYDNALLIPYHRIRREPRRTIRDIADYLALPFDPRQISLIHDETAFEKVKASLSKITDAPGEAVDAVRNWDFDPETHFHPNHIRDGRSGNGRRMLTPEQRRAVRDLVRRHRHL